MRLARADELLIFGPIAQLEAFPESRPLPEPPRKLCYHPIIMSTQEIPADHQEVEWQFDAPDLGAVERWLGACGDGSPVRVSPGPTLDITDAYMDTDDWRLHRAGYVLRVRQDGHGREATMKGLGGLEQGIRKRRELTEPLDGESHLTTARGPVGERVRLLSGRREVRPLFELRNLRKPYVLELGGERLGEVLLDQVSVQTDEGHEEARLSRVEVEVEDASNPMLVGFVDELRTACDLQPASVSKFEMGLRARGLSATPAPDLGSTEVDGSLTLGEVAHAVLRQHFGAMLADEPGSRLGEDPEEVHDMRVAIRRLRAAISLFKDALSPSTLRLREELGWIASALGEVRDLDVQLERLSERIAAAPAEERDGLEPLAGILQEHRTKARVRMLEALDSRRYARLVEAFGKAVRRPPSPRVPGAAVPVLAGAPGLLEKRYTAFRKAGDRIDPVSPPEEYHELRIKGKRLRYALEFLSPVYGKPAKSLIRSLVDIQDILGAHQDAYVAVESLRELSGGSDVPPRTAFEMGRLARQYEELAGGYRKRFPKAYGKIGGKPWKRLGATMEKHRT